jgi:hypothetical protein
MAHCAHVSSASGGAEAVATSAGRKLRALACPALVQCLSGEALQTWSSTCKTLREAVQSCRVLQRTHVVLGNGAVEQSMADDHLQCSQLDTVFQSIGGEHPIGKTLQALYFSGSEGGLTRWKGRMALPECRRLVVSTRAGGSASALLEHGHLPRVESVCWSRGLSGKEAQRLGALALRVAELRIDTSGGSRVFGELDPRHRAMLIHGVRSSRSLKRLVLVDRCTSPQLWEMGGGDQTRRRQIRDRVREAASAVHGQEFVSLLDDADQARDTWSASTLVEWLDRPFEELEFGGVTTEMLRALQGSSVSSRVQSLSLSHPPWEATEPSDLSGLLSRCARRTQSLSLRGSWVQRGLGDVFHASLTSWEELTNLSLHHDGAAAMASVDLEAVLQACGRHLRKLHVSFLPEWAREEGDAHWIRRLSELCPSLEELTLSEVPHLTPREVASLEWVKRVDIVLDNSTRVDPLCPEWRTAVDSLGASGVRRLVTSVFQGYRSVR